MAIIGAGLTGLSAALHLARKSADVHVFEKDTVGFGASGRNGGMATTGLSIGFRAGGCPLRVRHREGVPDDLPQRGRHP
ncbi:FAD-dependent oxidoreductase [Streptomyces swartbergensis]|uniref:FAD-dependent oxidoreductase n=1 Tax=Streptomyces swartbergensis TaxID=487165 RepID=UPI00380C1024